MKPEDVFSMRGKNIDPVSWDAIAPFSADAIAETMTLRPETGFAEIRSAVTNHVAWCYRQGLSLKRDVVFDDNVITRRFEAYEGSKQSVSTYRSRVRMVAKILKGTWTERNQNYTHPVVISPPYSEKEVDHYLQWTQDARSEMQRHNRLVAFALGLGGGLRPLEIKAAKVRDVVVDGDSVAIETAKRFVPIEDDYAEIVADACEGRNPDEFLVYPGYVERRHDTGLTKMALELSGEKCVGPDFRQLRSTRIVQLMRRGLNEQLICAVMGLTRLDSYAEFRRKYSREDVLEMRDQIVGKQTRLRAV